MAPTRSTPRSGRRRHRSTVSRRRFRGCAVAASAVAGPDDLARVRLNLHLDDTRATLAIRHIGFGATRTHACILRRIAPLLLLPEPWAPDAGCGHARTRRAADHACASCPACSAARPCARTSTSTTPPGANAASRAGLPVPPYAMAALSSRPSAPAPGCAGPHSPCAATRPCCACSIRCRLAKERPPGSERLPLSARWHR